MRLLLGVCGSISAYKTYDLARDLIKQGHQVKVLLTKGAENFVQAQVYRYLGIQDVYLDQDDFRYPTHSSEAPVLHVQLAQWAERLVIAPLSANTLSQLAMGRATNLLESVFLAMGTQKPVLLFPAMNTQMLQHPFVAANFDLLKRLELHPNLYLAPTDSGLLACGDVGEGKLLDVESLSALATTVTPIPSVKPAHLMITLGATKAPLDPVRFLTNPSSGLTGAILAEVFHRQGHELTLIAGEEAYKKFNWLRHLPRTRLLMARTTQDMANLVEEHLPRATHYLSPAAIGDMEFSVQDTKIKKQTMAEALAWTPSRDILKWVLDHRHPNLKVVGFAAETSLDEQIIQTKLASKPVDLLVATLVHGGDHNQAQLGFGATSAQYKIYQSGQLAHEGQLTKREMAQKILELLF